MGRRSVKENKNIYFESREETGMTRAQASEALEFISESRLEKIESDKTLPRPDEVLQMSKKYGKPMICNYYCSHECEIGQEYVPEICLQDLSRITLQMLSSLNSANREKDRLIEITADGEISENELYDFARIQNQLNSISIAADTLQLWIKKKIADGTIDKGELERLQNKLAASGN